MNLSLINLNFKYIYIFFMKKVDILVKKRKRGKEEKKITNIKNSTFENIEKCQ